MQTFAVTVPRGVGPGQQFQASLDGQLTMVIVPRGSGPSSRLPVQIPMRPTNAQKYAVTIPAGVHPGGRFQANLGGKFVWLSCPRSLGPGKQMFVDVSAGLQQRAIPWPPPIGVPEELESTKIPDCFLCPIKGELMRQPAITPDGITYDYDGIVGWLQNKPTDPSTNHPLSSRDLIPNRLLRTMIEEFISKGPDFLRDK